MKGASEEKILKGGVKMNLSNLLVGEDFEKSGELQAQSNFEEFRGKKLRYNQ